jgi:hypothetical protein
MPHYADAVTFLTTVGCSCETNNVPIRTARPLLFSKTESQVAFVKRMQNTRESTAYSLAS